jgi:hypothetical protein
VRVLRNRSLGATIGLGFASLLVMLAAIVALAIREVDVAQDHREELAMALEAAEVADRLALSIARSDAALRDFVLSRLPADQVRARRLRESAEAAALVLRRAPPDDPESRQLIDQVIAAAEAWDQQAATAGALAGNLRPEGAAPFQDQFIKSGAVEVFRSVDRLREHLTGRVSDLRQAIGERGDQLTQSLVVGFGLAGLVGILLGVYFVRLVTDPVARLVELADAVRTGDYRTARRLIGTADPQELGASGNEIDHLTTTFSEMTDTLEERETRLRTQASNLARINQLLAALQSLTDAALSEISFEERLQQLLQRVLTGVAGSAGIIFLRHPPTGRLEPRVVLDPAAGGLAGVPTPDAAAFAEAVAESSEELLVPDRDQSPYHDHPFFGSRPIGSFCALPVRINNQVVGVGYVEFGEPGEFEPSRLHLLRVFA